MVAAFQLLSRFPFPVQVPYEERVLRRSVVFYPVVGFAIGLVLLTAGYLLSAVLPAAAASALLTGIWVSLTGGLHMDGLMDTADGLLSHRSRERMLEIMKDSRVGAMGVIACVLQLLLKFAFLDAMLASGWSGAAGLVLAAPIWSRWFMVAAIALWPYARGNEGMGSMFTRVGSRQLLGCSVLAVLLSLAGLAVFGGGLRDAFVLSSAGLLLAGLPGTLLARRIAAKLGGLTGDTYGAINELVETALLLAAVLYIISGI
jgi:adenosylcobinamide-GDP ribazoletransferase